MSLQENRSGKNMIEATAIRAVQEVFGETKDWRILKKGMTNRSYVFSAEGERFIIRVPGEGTSKLINRHQEAEVYRAISGLGFCDDPVYLNPNSGIKITRYMEGVRTCDAHSEADVARCMELLKNLHAMKLKVHHTFDLFGQITFYESLRKDRSVYPDYEETMENVFLLQNHIDRQDKTICLSHIDAVSDNFLFCSEDLQLTDWEYSGMHDPHIDIAMFCVYENFTREAIDRLINIYFNGDCNRETRIKIYCYIAACGLLWSNWCEYKHQLGVDFGGYALQQYQYAKDFYRIATQEMKKL